MHFSDDLYMGGFTPPFTLPGRTPNPTINQGVGPMGRIAFRNIVPLTKGSNNVALSQHMTSGTGLTLTAGTGVTSTTLPTGQTALVMDVPRCLSLASTANLSAITFTFSGYDEYSQLQTVALAGPNNNTVNTLKAFKWLVSITPGTTDGANNVTAGTADIFGLPFVAADAGYIMPKWANALGLDAGTFTTADVTSPATSSTGDTRGTYAPSSPSNGSRRLVVWHHLIETQCGAGATQVAAIGVTPV